MTFTYKVRLSSFGNTSFYESCENALFLIKKVIENNNKLLYTKDLGKASFRKLQVMPKYCLWTSRENLVVRKIFSVEV